MGLFLVGPMGAGKSAIGKELARVLGRQFHDTDAIIQARTGADIGFIFDREGEAGFRRREREVIDELTAHEGVVIATGGGAVLDPDNRRHLSTRGTVIYLHTGVASQAARTRAGRNRPLLDTEDPTARLAALFEIRDPLYREIADFIVETDGRRVRTVAQEILELVRCND